jgi:hypothetical protein
MIWKSGVLGQRPAGGLGCNEPRQQSGAPPQPRMGLDRRQITVDARGDAPRLPGPWLGAPSPPGAPGGPAKGKESAAGQPHRRRWIGPASDRPDRARHESSSPRAMTGQFRPQPTTVTRRQSRPTSRGRRRVEGMVWYQAGRLEHQAGEASPGPGLSTPRSWPRHAQECGRGRSGVAVQSAACRIGSTRRLEPSTNCAAGSWQCHFQSLGTQGKANLGRLSQERVGGAGVMVNKHVGRAVHSVRAVARLAHRLDRPAQHTLAIVRAHRACRGRRSWP